MIYVHIYYAKKEDHLPTDHEVKEVAIIYPNEEDFMKERIKEIISPRNGHLKVQKGVYIGMRGFFPNALEIHGDNGFKEEVIITLPMGSCIIKEYFNF